MVNELALTLDEVNDLLEQLEHEAYGYSDRGIRVRAVVTKMQQWRDRQVANETGEGDQTCPKR